MNIITVDTADPDWQTKLEDALILDKAEADLTACGPEHEPVCKRLAAFLRLCLTVDETTRTACFRKHPKIS
jgi:hypothetical protein